MYQHIIQAHGSGGLLTQELIKNVFYEHLKNEILLQQGDAAVCSIGKEHIAISTDSFVIDPIFFPGGDIGKLSVCGTVNDLAVVGAKPQFLSAAFILEEQFSIEELSKIVQSMSDEARRAGVFIVAGDTKVVGKGQCDKIFITTTGVGIVPEERLHLVDARDVQPGDVIVVNGTLGDHGMSIMIKRHFENFWMPVISDCACLNGMIEELFHQNIRVKFMRDATRGGLATVLNEIAHKAGCGIELYEEQIPITEAVAGACEVLGFDPLYVANEGKVVIVVDKEDVEKAVDVMQRHEQGRQSSIIGCIVAEHKGKVLMHTRVGGRRIVDMLADDQLPRIC